MHLLRRTLGASGGCYLDTRVQMRGSFRACKERRNLTTYRRSFNLGVQKMGIWKAWCRSPLKWCLMRLPAILTLQMVKALEVTASRPLFTKLLFGHSVSPLASHPPRNTSLASICPETVRLNCYSYSLPPRTPGISNFFRSWFWTKVRERNVARDKPRTRHVFGDLIVARCACTRGGHCASAALARAQCS